MTPTEMAVAILDDTDLDRRDRRIRALLERQRKPLRDPMAAAVVRAGSNLEGRQDEWFRAAYRAVHGPHDWAGAGLLGACLCSDTSDPNAPDAAAARQRLDKMLQGIRVPYPESPGEIRDRLQRRRENAATNGQA